MKRRRTNYKPFLSRRSERKARNRLFLTLIIGGIVLYSLFTWFLPALISNLSFFNRFKPTPKQEASIAENATLAPPVLNIPFEATNSAQIIIKGYSISHAKVEIYIDEELKTTTETDEGGSFTSGQVDLGLGSNSISGKTINEKGAKSLVSKAINIVYDQEKPKLELLDPGDNQIITGERKIQVRGNTDPQDNVSVTVNGMRVIIQQDGNFTEQIELADGDNEIVVIAQDLAGNTTQITRKITFQP